MIPLLIALAAHAAPAEQTLTWSLQVEGQPLGTRTLTVKYLPSRNGLRRVLESWTELDGRIGPLPIHYRERLTANIERDPASFLSVQETNGDTREVQARRAALGWMVSISEDDRARSYDIPSSQVDLSTVDLFDPESVVPLSRFAHARVLSAETGSIFEGDVTPLEPVSVTVRGTELAVQPYRFTHEEGVGVFYYTGDGYLVRYEMRVLGYDLVGVLTEPPPAGPDDIAVQGEDPVVEQEL
ncbi:MAG: hypothetical protein JXX28_16415 [Deltaproteobacteria bacterium]|nr:hypothetical protein [Deltaproteobacteria bacterium]